jgi:aryl-alcohol dehydrogenase-like predicted oxidoreductase
MGGAGIGHAWGESDDRECVRAVEKAIDLGVNFFDTSPVYGAGQSEINLGEGISGHRNEVVIASKVRLRTAEALDDMNGAIRESVDSSLRRLGTDHIDILQVHHQLGSSRGEYISAAGPPPRYAYLLDKSDALDISDVMSDLEKEGKIRFKGITGWDGNAGVIGELLATGKFDTAQILYNVLNQSACDFVPSKFNDVDQGQAMNVAQNHNVGVIGIRSHAAGALCDILDRESDQDSPVLIDFNRSRLLEALKDSVFKTISQIALRFCLDNNGIHTVIPGVKTVSELEEAVACSEMPPLSEVYMSEIADMYVNNFYV